MDSPYAISKLETLMIIFVFVFSFVFFFQNTFMFWDCLFAALITTALFTATYMICRWFYLALTR
ncbi:MAG: hypothetical protein KDK62_03410 [Chlamydiia bacterium]|nr:hypothetical protein [Chlamydiia bacterium]